MLWTDKLTLKERFHWIRGLLKKHKSHDGKVQYPTLASAERAAAVMHRKNGRDFDAYRCIWGKKHWHIGGSVRR